MIKLIIVNPQGHTSQELRTLVHYLNSVAADIDAGRVKSDAVAQGRLSAETEPLLSLDQVREKFEAKRDARETGDQVIDVFVQDLLGDGSAPEVHTPVSAALGVAPERAIRHIHGEVIRTFDGSDPRDGLDDPQDWYDLDLSPKNSAVTLEATPTAVADVAAEETTLAEDMAASEATFLGAAIPDDKPLVSSGATGDFAEIFEAPEPAQIPPVEYEDVVTGYAPGNVPFAEGHDRASYEAAGWTLAALVEYGHLAAVTEQRAKPSAVSVSGAAPAPAAPAPNAAPSPAVQLDADNLPWDARIHSDAAEKMAKTGYWKTRRNLAEGYKEQIEAELRAVMNAGKPSVAATQSVETDAAATVPPAPAVEAGNVPSPATTTTAVVAAPPAPSVAPAPVPSPAPGAVPAEPTTFAEFTRWIVSHTAAKRMTQTDVSLAVMKTGLTHIPDLAKRPDLIPTVVADLRASKGV